jgi:hypothetical protein
VAFIVIFNFCVFFLPYDLVLALWDVVNERAPFRFQRNRNRARPCWLAPYSHTGR